MALSLHCGVEPLGAPAGTRASGGSANGPSIAGGLSAREDLRVGLARIGDWAWSEASTMLDREALCRIEARCLAELADLQELVPKVWDVPEPPPGLHNWVVAQSLVASLSASGRWPRFAGHALSRMVERLFRLPCGLAAKEERAPTTAPQWAGWRRRR